MRACTLLPLFPPPLGVVGLFCSFLDFFFFTTLPCPPAGHDDAKAYLTFSSEEQADSKCLSLLSEPLPGFVAIVFVRARSLASFLFLGASLDVPLSACPPASLPDLDDAKALSDFFSVKNKLIANVFRSYPSPTDF